MPSLFMMKEMVFKFQMSAMNVSSNQGGEQRQQQHQQQVEEELGNQEVPTMEQFKHQMQPPFSATDQNSTITTTQSPAAVTSPAANTRSLALSSSSSLHSLNRSANHQPASVLDHNWQANKTTVRERNAVMFNNEMMADVYFKVRQQL